MKVVKRIEDATVETVDDALDVNDEMTHLHAKSEIEDALLELHGVEIVEALVVNGNRRILRDEERPHAGIEIIT